MKRIISTAIIALALTGCYARSGDVRGNHSVSGNASVTPSTDVQARTGDIASTGINRNPGSAATETTADQPDEDGAGAGVIDGLRP